ncbi:MAG: IPT/TIG domain-containing protein, partial [Ignavibacteria bacterium]|nr:IPT/TIG domain-containing protein [Ignavibacteria bacterium]
KDPPSLQKIIDNMAQTLNPKITAITPNTADQGDKGFTMTVTGVNFVYGSVIKFNGTTKSTTYVSATEIKAEIPASDVFKTGEYDISVYSPIMGGKTSNSEKFIVQTSSGFPWTWIAIGGGAVAAVVVAVLTLGGKDDPASTLAEPPGRP